MSWILDNWPVRSFCMGAVIGLPAGLFAGSIATLLSGRFAAALYGPFVLEAALGITLFCLFLFGVMIWIENDIPDVIPTLWRRYRGKLGMFAGMVFLGAFLSYEVGALLGGLVVTLFR